MKVKFNKARWSVDSEGTWLSVLVPHTEAVKFINTMKDREYTAELKEYRERRSLDANAYFWSLCNKLSEVIGIAPDDIYREMIHSVGGNFTVLPIRDDAVNGFIDIWQNKGIGWLCEVIGESKLNGYTNVRAYHGSSTYDTKQMSRLISLMVDECKANGIETMTPNELDALIRRWGDVQAD